MQFERKWKLNLPMAITTQLPPFDTLLVFLVSHIFIFSSFLLQYTWQHFCVANNCITLSIQKKNLFIFQMRKLFILLYLTHFLSLHGCALNTETTSQLALKFSHAIYKKKIQILLISQVCVKRQKFFVFGNSGCLITWRNLFLRFYVADNDLCVCVMKNYQFN